MSALHRALVEFDRGPGAGAGVRALAVLKCPKPAHLSEPDADEPASEPARDPVGDAVAAALAEAEAAHAAAVAAAEARFAADLLEARARWAADEGRALADAIRRAAAEAEDRLAEATAAVLEPFVVEAVRRAAVADLRVALTDLLAGGAGGRIAVTGPRDLLDAIGADIGDAGADAIDFAVSEAAEVTITADSSVVRTRLADWASGFRRRLEGDA